MKLLITLMIKKKNKIPKNFILNIKKEMDEQYEFKLDYTKDFKEQNLMTETKAILVNLYKMYFSNEEEKLFFKKYDRLCFEKIEKKKTEKYNPDDIFNKSKLTKEVQTTEENQKIIVQQRLFCTILCKIKNFLKKLHK